MNDELKTKTKKILQDNLYMTISVAGKDGKPWISNVFYAYDTAYNFYWYSPKNSLHSKMICENQNIAIAIFNSTAVGNEVDAVYIQAKAHEISYKAELINGCACYARRLIATNFMGKKIDAENFVKRYHDFESLSVLRMYMAIPEKFWKLAPSKIFNDKNVDSRIEIAMNA